MGARSVFNLNPIQDQDGITTSQSVGGAGSVPLDGANVVSGVAKLGNNHLINIVSAGNDSGITFTITGTQSDGTPVTEVVTGANAGTATSTRYFKTITSIVVSGATAGVIEIGTSGLATTDWFLITEGLETLQVGIFVEMASGAVLTWREEHTPDDIHDLATMLTTEPFVLPHKELVSKAASDDGNIYFPPVASRIATTAFTSGSFVKPTLKATYIRYGD